MPILWSLLGASGPTAAYLAQIATDARSPFWFVEIDQPVCTRVMGTLPCTATVGADGTRCYYTYHTCHDRPNFASQTKTWHFSSADVPLPVLIERGYSQIYPILKTVSPVSQEVDVEQSFTRTDKMTLTFHELGSTDESIAELQLFNWPKTLGRFNTSRRGLFWRRLVNHWPNFRNAEIRIKRGFNTPAFRIQDMLTVWRGKIETIKFGEKGDVTLTAVDLLRGLEKQIPPKLSSENVVTVNISRTGTTLTVRDASKITDPSSVTGDVVIAVAHTETGRSEKMVVTARNTSTNELTVTRGAYGTPADPHYVDETLREVVIYATDDDVNGLDPIDIVLDLLNRAGVVESDINTSSLRAAGAWCAGMRLKREIIEPVELRKLVFEIGELMASCNFFVDEALKVRAAHMFAPAAPGELTGTVTDDPNVLVNTGSANTNEKEGRLTHCSLYFDKKPDAQAAVSSGDIGPTQSSDYDSVMLFVDLDLFSANYYGNTEEDKREKKIKDAGAWLRRGDFPQALITASRWVRKSAHAPVIFMYKAELRDHPNLIIGSVVDVTTTDIMDMNGDADTVRCRVMKKAHDANTHGFQATLRAIGGEVLDDTNGGTRALRYAIIGPPTMAATYDTASASDLLYGYIGDATNEVGAANADGYYIF